MHRGSTKVDDSFDAMRRASVSDSFDKMRKSSAKKKDDLFQFCEYDREAEKRYESAKAFRIPKKTPSATPTTSGNQNAVTMAVRNILREMEDPVTSTAAMAISEEDMAMEEKEESMEVEVTEVEIVLMD